MSIDSHRRRPEIRGEDERGFWPRFMVGCGWFILIMIGLVLLLFGACYISLRY